MAVVYLADQPDLGRRVALKELSSLHAADPSWARRFVSESRIAGSLGHPNIVTVHDYFEHDGTPYIAMEYMEQGSLRPFVGKLSLGQIGGVLEGLLAGLGHAHARGIVHRDLKPENLMVTGEGGIKIADFGIAKALHAPATAMTLTQAGMTVGTPAYMAPEQAMAKDIGPHTDLYSTGVIAYELLTGTVPFSNTDTPWAILHAHIYDPPPPLRSLDPEIDPAVAAWVEQLLAKEPDDRPRDARDAWHALEDILLAGIGPVWRREARVLARPDQAATDGAPTPPATGERATRSHVTPAAPTDAVAEEPEAAPPEPEPEPEPAPVAVAPPDPLPEPIAIAPEATLDAATMPPAAPPRDETYEWPELGGGRRPNRRLLLGIAALVVLGIAGFALAVTVLGGSDENAGRPEATASGTATTAPTPFPRPTANRVRVSAPKGAVVTSIGFTGAALSPNSVRVRDADLSDGRARVEIRQKGIRSIVGVNRLGGVTVRPTRAANLLVFTLTAKPGAFTSVKDRLQNGRRTLVLQSLRSVVVPPPPPPPVQPPPSPPPVQPPSSPPPPPVQPPPPPPPPPPPQGTTAG